MYNFIAFSGSSSNSLLPSFLIEEFESMESWLPGLLDRPRVRTCSVKSCICSVWNNAFSVSIHLPSPSDVRFLLLMFYDVWFHKKKKSLVSRHWPLLSVNEEWIWSMEGMLNLIPSPACFLIISWDCLMAMAKMLCEFMKVFMLVEKNRTLDKVMGALFS